MFWALAWPGETLTITSLASDAPQAGTVTHVTLLGHEGALPFTQTPDGLRVTLPAQIGDHAFTFKIHRDSRGDSL